MEEKTNLLPEPQKDFEKPIDPQSSQRKRIIGAFMALTSSLCFSICSLIVKYMKDIDPLELSSVRFVGLFVPTLFVVLCIKINPLGPREKSWVLLVRAIFGAASLMMQFYAIRHMPLGDASTIIFSAPVFVAVFARIFLKELFLFFNFLMILLTILGVILITRPPFLFGDLAYREGYSEEILTATVVGLLGVIFNANVYVLLRYLKDVHYMVIMFTYSIFAIILSLIATGIFGRFSLPTRDVDYGLIVLLAGFSFGGQTLLTKSLQFEEAGPVAIYRTADIVFAFVWQISFLNEMPNVYSVCGACLVVFSVILTGLRKYFESWPGPVEIIARCKARMCNDRPLVAAS